MVPSVEFLKKTLANDTGSPSSSNTIPPTLVWALVIRKQKLTKTKNIPFIKNLDCLAFFKPTSLSIKKASPNLVGEAKILLQSYTLFI
jgi:hypothetical protein